MFINKVFYDEIKRKSNELQEENKQLKQEYAEQMEIMLDDEKINLEYIKRLEDALRKCSPYSCRAIQFSHTSEPQWEDYCIFCDEFEKHKPDCEYILLCEDD